ncbi:MAG TPA: helix-turn-helix transcriptional regulator [Acidimicrobiales bacterium]|jgi:transcriptional regulator with XRE-family HTH domain|nr:helix-turn-helix transcriptional regulator [Acidimicrobiales bacterium]
MASLDESARLQLQALGDFIRNQRHMAELSLRDLAARTNVSNPYLSQIERGLHEPSVRVLKAIATALNVSAESLLMQAGLLEGEADAGESGETAAAIEHDPHLKPEQRTALLAVYQSYLEANAAETDEAGSPQAETEDQPAARGAKKPRDKARGSSKKKS